MFPSTLQLAIFIHIFLLCCSLPGKIAGPGTFVFQSFGNCDPAVTELDLKITQRKFNRTTNVIDIELDSPWPLSDETIMEVQTATKTDGGYKSGSFYLKGPFCKTLQTLAEGLLHAIIEVAGVDDCPLPGSLKIDGFYIESDMLNDQILYGEFRGDVKLFINEELKGCYLIYFMLVPEED